MAFSFRQVILAVLLALLVERLVRFTILLGFYSSIYTHYPGTCRGLAGIVDGSEDIVVTSTGLAFISSGARQLQDPSVSIVGRIFLFDFNHPDEDPKEVTVEGGGIQDNGWIPLGMDVWESGPKDKPTFTLYVVNRKKGHVGIEVFDFMRRDKKPILKHRRKITDQNIWRPNDLILVGEEQFYVTNDGYLPKLVANVELVLGLKVGTVAYYDAGEARIVITGIGMANGISMSPDKKLLYVAAATEKKIYVFKVNVDGSFTQVQGIALTSIPDNIDVDKNDGSLWVGCHPSMYAVIIHTGFGQILKINVDSAFNYTIREVFADDTGLIQGSSIACRHRDAIIIGTVKAKAAYCELLTS
ncbi:serum paraoxonase/arylesterase 2-like [Diadema setosum]|uniref:serum paraoxonase/arylesterase 2-like n=1 Tax=Diadema setosum TaxID=31175 RepID=UPI003B3AE395